MAPPRRDCSSAPTLNARVINIDDAFGRELAGAASRPGSTGGDRACGTPRTAAAHVMATQVLALADGFDLSLASSWGNARLRVPLLGEFNVDNVLTTLAVLLAAQVPLSAGARRPGAVCRRAGAHAASRGAGRPRSTPPSLSTTPTPRMRWQKALAAARGHCQGRLHVVFGCGGDRDALKRPIMGRIAADRRRCRHRHRRQSALRGSCGHRPRHSRRASPTAARQRPGRA